MIMAGYEYMGEMPFRNVYFTGIIRDKQGRKMSKTLGNSPDPLDLIAKYGADALRFGIDAQRAARPGRALRRKGRRTRPQLLQQALERLPLPPDARRRSPKARSIRALLTSDDKWILLRLDTAIREITDALDEYRFSEATQRSIASSGANFATGISKRARPCFYGDDDAAQRRTRSP